MNNAKERRWLITKTTPDIIIQMLKDQLTLRDAFLSDDTVRVTAISDDDSMRYLYHAEADWDKKHSICLPDADEFIDADDGEFDEEIAYYERFHADCGLG